MTFGPNDGGAGFSGPSISSDKDDYRPGETVTLTGGNWQPGERVQVWVDDDETKTWQRNVDVVADENGNIADQFDLPDWFVATYQVVATGEHSGTATFEGKANIQDITDPLAPVSVDGNATRRVAMTDAGEPGSKDSIGITVWNKNGGVWFSSNWNGTNTIEQLLGGGNLVVR